MPTLDWIGKDKVINHHKDVPYKLFERKYSFDESGMHKENIHSNNMIIHGDNLEALKSLLPQYEGKIKCIYIDPPYNTGNEGWIYNDNVNDPKIKKWLGEVVGKEGEDLSRHDKWLCMMYPRLVLLQKLLSDDGVIFISIDGNEYANLKIICDEIFGATNYIDSISWFKKASPSNDARFFSNDIEYILVYSKNSMLWKPHRLPLTQKQLKYYSNPDNDNRGDWNSATYTCNKTREERPNLYYPIVNPKTGKEVLPKETAVWKYSKSQTEVFQEDNRLFWGVDGTAKMPRIKKFLFEHEGVVNRTLWHYDDVNHTQGASNQLKNLNITGFSTPKPFELIERIVRIASDSNSIILDSFAGSGTTAHAVLNMNKSDGGNRKFILVEMGDYADTITAERVKRVINGYGEGNKAVAGIPGDFTYYELGQPLFKDDKNLNEEVPEEEIRKYVYYMETKKPLETETTDNPYLLGKNNDTAYYFYYKKDEITTLNHEFLSTINTKATEYIVYADKCVLAQEVMEKFNIVFKKIPRDITRL